MTEGDEMPGISLDDLICYRGEIHISPEVREGAIEFHPETQLEEGTNYVVLTREDCGRFNADKIARFVSLSGYPGGLPILMGRIAESSTSGSGITVNPKDLPESYRDSKIVLLDLDGI